MGLTTLRSYLVYDSIFVFIYVAESQELFMFGDNRFGQLGIGSSENAMPSPQLVARDIILVSCECAQHTVALTSYNVLGFLDLL